MEDGFGSEHKSKRGGVRAGGSGGAWGVNQPASLPFVVQMSPVTVKERAGLMIGGACFKL